MTNQVRVVITAVLCGLWPIASGDFGEKIIADVKSSDKPEFELQFTNFDSYNPSYKTKQYSTRYKSSNSNTVDASSQQPHEGRPTSSIVAPPVNFMPHRNNEDPETSANFNHYASYENDQHEDEVNPQLLTVERSDTDVNEQPLKTGKRRINSEVFRKRLRERLRQRLQNDTVNTSENSQDASTTSKPTTAFRSRARFRGTSKKSTNEETTSKPNSEKIDMPSLLNQRLHPGRSRRGNNTFYTKYRGRTPSAITNSRGLRLRSRETTTTTEKVATQSQVSFAPSHGDTFSSQLHSDLTKKDVLMKPSPIDSSNMKQSAITNEFVPGSGSTKFEDIFSDFRSKQRDVRVTKRPKSPPQRHQVSAPEVLPTTVPIQTKINNPSVKTFAVTKLPSVLQSSFNAATLLPEKNTVSPLSQIRSTVYQFGPSYSAVEHDKSQEQQLIKEDKSFIVKLEPQEIHMDDEHFPQSQNRCDARNDPQCRLQSGALNTSILESTRDIIKQAETAEVQRERSRPLREFKTTRPSSWHDAPAPNVRQQTPGPESAATGHSASSEGSLYRDDVVSGSSSDSWHQRRTKQEIDGRTKELDNIRTKPIQSVDFNEAYTPRPAVFTTFEHFLRIHGVTDSPFTVVQAPNNHSSPQAVSFQNSYLGSFDEFSKTTSKIPANLLTGRDHPNSLKSSKSSLALADLTLNTLKGANHVREHNLFFRTPSSLLDTTTLKVTTTPTPPLEQRLRHTRVVDHHLHPTTQNYNAPISYSHYYSHREERSTVAPNSLRFANALSFEEQPILPKRKVTPSAAVRDKFSNKLRNQEKSSETLHHQVLQSPKEPVFITHQKRTEFPHFPTPSVVRHPHMKDANNNNIPTSSHFKAVLLEDGKENIVSHSRARQSGHTPRAPNSDHSLSLRQEEFINSILHPRQANIRPLRPRPLRNSRPSLGRLPRGPNPQENFFQVLRPRNQANSMLNSFMRPPPPQRRTQSRTILRPRPISKSRNRPRRVKDAFSVEESRNSIVMTPPRVPFIRTSQFNAGGHKLNGLSNHKRKITSRAPSIPPHSFNKIHAPSHKPLQVSQRPQIVLNSRPPITSLPAHLQLSPNFAVPSRNARHSAFQNQILFPSNFHKPDPIDHIAKHHSPLKTRNHFPQFNTAQFPPTIKPTSKESKSQFREQHSETENHEPVRHQLRSQRQPTPSSPHVHTVRELEPVHQNEISLSAISQPLPHHVLLKTSRSKMAESHVSLLKNLQFGVNGEPLDVWIPMKSDRTLKLVGRGQTPLAARAPVRPRNSIPIPVDLHSDSSMTERVDPLQTSESFTVPEYAIKDVMDGDKAFDYNDYDEYKDRLDEPQAASSVEEVVAPAQEETADYPDYQDAQFGQREDDVEDDQTQQEEQQDDEEDVFEEDDDDL